MTPFFTKANKGFGMSNSAQVVRRKPVSIDLLIGAAAMSGADTRLQECEHRIKNHLQLIASALALQARDTADERVSEALMQACGRISAVARVHARLQDLEQGEDIEASSFLSGLCADLSACLDAPGVRPLRLAVDADIGRMPVNQALPVGLIVNELIINAVKHGGAAQPIGVFLLRDGSGWRLVVSDRGPGMDPAILQSKDPRLGRRLLHTLTRQIGGTLSVESSSRGTSIAVRFGGRTPY
jgi:two-component system, sensor histidine kinase PdtaS